MGIPEGETRMRTKLAAACMTIALALAGRTASAQVSVTATAGTTGPTPYVTLTDAFTAINAGTHQGDITIDIQASTNEGAVAAVLNSSGAGAALYTTVLIRPTTDGVSISGASVSGRGIIELNGADSVTIDGDNPNTAGINRNLTIQNTALNTTTFTSVVRMALSTLVTTGNNLTVKNAIILGSATGRNVAAATSTVGSEFTTYGILVGGGASIVTTTTPPSAITSVTTVIPAGQTATNFTASNNQIDACARGIAMQGSAVTVAPGMTITDNVIGSATPGNVTTVYARALTLQGFDTTTISGNTIRNIEFFVATAQAGIFLGDASTIGQNAVVEKNIVTNVLNSASGTFGAYGINVNAGAGMIVRNNFVSGINHVMTGGAAFSTTFGVFGIRIGLGTGHKVYHNSVNLFGVQPGTPNTSLLSAALAIVATTQTGVDVRNNAFANTLTGGTTSIAHVCYYLPSSATIALNLTLNNNGCYTGTTAGVHGVAHVGTVYTAVPAGPATYAGLYTVANFNPGTTFPTTNFRAYTSTLSAGGQNDGASFATTAAAPYTSTSDLHIPNGSTTLLESRGVGTATTGVTTDIDGEARPNGVFPDAGADEFTGTGAPANDIAAAGIATPTPGSIIPTGTTVSPQAAFHNPGNTTQTNIGVQFVITGPGGYSYTDSQVIASLAMGQSVAVTFAAAPAFNAVGTYNITASVTTPDSNPANDQVSGSFDAHDPLAGTYSVPGSYPSLTNTGGVFQDLNAVGATGNVVLNVTADLTAETGTFALNQLAGGFTVIIKPSGAARTISGTSTTLGLIKLNAADNVTIDGSLSGGTDRSLTIMNGNAGATVIWIASLVGNGSTGNTVKNCILSGLPGVTAIAGVLSGSSATFGGVAEAPNSNNTIQNNAIFRVQNSAFLSGAVAFDQNWLITGNTFGSTVPADKNIFRGMLLGGAANYTISNNVIAGVQSTATTASAMSGIQLSALHSNGQIFGNRISDIKNVSATGTGAYGINIGSTSTAANVNVFNNFIWDVTGLGSATLGSNGLGFFLTAGGGYNIRYNSVLMGTNQTNATGITAAFHITTGVTTAASLDIRDNIFANTQTVGTRYAIYDQGTAAHYSTINFNDYFSSQNVGFLTTARVTLADWQAATGQDLQSKAVDPLFVSATNLHLQPTTPLIAQGTPIAGITTDIDGDPRNATNPDIGADEQIRTDLAVSKTDTPDPVTAGANLTYTVTVNNLGPVAAVNASLGDPLPAGTTFVSLAPPAGWNCTTPPVGSGGTVTCTNASFANGASAVFPIIVNVSPTVPDGTVLSNTATITSGTADPNQANQASVATTTVQAFADLAVTKTDAPDPVPVGTNLTYTITVANNGPSNAATASLADGLPTGTRFVSLASAAGWTCSTPPVGGTGTVSCTNGSVPPGNNTFTLVVAVDLTVPPGTVITNTATASAATTDPSPGNESASTTTVVEGVSNIGLFMTVNNAAPPVGTNVTFTISAFNGGPSVSSGVQVTDLLPPGLTFVSATPSAGTYTQATGVWNIGNLLMAKGTSASLQLVATVNRPEMLVNQAVKTGHNESDPNASDNAAVVALNGPATADIRMSQQVTNPTPPVGTNVTFGVSATNSGPAAVTGLVVTDVLPAGLTFVSATPSQGTYIPATGIWDVGSVAANNSATLQLTATVTSGGALTNVAAKTALTETDLSAVNDSTSMTINGTNPADVALGKTASQEPVSSGTQFRYTIVTSNNGPAPATGVIVLDGLPAGVTLVSATPSQGTCSGTTNVSCPLGTLRPGGSAQVALVVTKTVGGNVSNLASVSATEADPYMPNNSNTAATTPVELLNIQVE